jgi:hypothetical protein
MSNMGETTLTMVNIMSLDWMKAFEFKFNISWIKCGH